MMNTNTVINVTRQLEFSLDRRAGHQPARRAPQRISRAEWWFRQMRRAVNEALDWSATPPAPAEQPWLLPARRPQVA
jgi:hypothetical protein